MNAQEFVKSTASLKDVFHEPCFRSVQEIFMPNSKNPRIPDGNRHREPISATYIQTLYHNWSQDPAAFFASWSLPADVSHGRNRQTDQDDNGEIDDSFVFGHRVAARSSTDAIRLIFHAACFHDIVLAQARRRKIHAKLPRGGALKDMIKKAWAELTGKNLAGAVANRLVEYVKVGSMCVRIGEMMGEISWLLCPLFVLERKRLPSNKQLASMTEKVRHLNIPNSIAHRIRELQRSLLLRSQVDFANVVVLKIHEIQRGLSLPTSSKRKCRIDSDRPVKRLKPEDHRGVKSVRPNLSNALPFTDASLVPLAMDHQVDPQWPCPKPLPRGIWDDVFWEPSFPKDWHGSPALLSLEPLPSGLWDAVFQNPLTRAQGTDIAFQPNIDSIPREIWYPMFYAPPTDVEGYIAPQ